MSFRKENKFRLSISDFYQIKNLLLSQGMTTLFEKRTINSIYYDTLNLDMFYNSEEGVLPRKKFRIRWYYDKRKSKIEKKISSTEGRFKTSVSLAENENFINHIIDQNYGVLEPSLKVSYERSYYSFNKVRLTLDSNITYVNPRISNFKKYKDPERVLEVKAAINTSDDFISKFFPYPNSRFSKYSRGILLTINNL